MQLRVAVLPFLLLWFSACAFAQENQADKLLEKLSRQPLRFEQLLEKQSEKYLDKLARQERKMQRKLERKDSAAAKKLFGEVDAWYQQLRTAGESKLYSGHLDSLETALKFLGQANLISNQEKLQGVLKHYADLQQKLNHTNKIRKLLKERQAQLKDQLQNTPLSKEFRKYQKELYYYRTQIDEYRHALEYRSSLEKKLLQTALKIPAFKKFFNKYSLLASVFRLPGNEEPSSNVFAGLQTRTSIRQQIEGQFGSGPNVASSMQQSIASAQSQLYQIKQKIHSLGQNGADLDVPNFKPNTQRTRSFWQRLEWGVNMQSIRGNALFPVTSDVGFFAGYKINDKSIAGIGASYKIGWGQNIRHIRLTHEGVGLRSFLDWKIKGSFYASGGFEYNFQQTFQTVRQLYGFENWQKSGLIGVSKIVSVNSKFFKKTKVQLLWDFLSYDLPGQQPIKLRVGYNF